MITNQDKIDIINKKIDNLNIIIQSYIDHAEEFKNKYVLEDKLIDCNARKNVLLEELNFLKSID